MDPDEYFLYEEFFNPGMKYECADCGTLFGEECLAQSEDGQLVVYTCPGCGRSGNASDVQRD